MSKIYNKYINNEDHVWYDSSNIIYSVCFDGPVKKSLKIVFKSGGAYLYSNIDPLDYVYFRDAESNGKAFNETIKKYPCTKLDNISFDELENMKQEFIKLDHPTEYNAHIEFNDDSGEFKLKINNVVVYEGIEGQVSIINLLHSMGLEYTMSSTEAHNQTIDDFEKKNIINKE